MGEKKMVKSNTKNIVLCGIFVALIIIGAYIRIPVSAIPITLQVQFVMCAGLFLGPYWGSLSAVVYMLMGLMGLPVFSAGGGIWYIMKPSFGYVIGFIAEAFVAGLITRRSKPSLLRTLTGVYAGLIAFYGIALIYVYVLSNFIIDSPIGVMAMLSAYFFMFIPGDFITCTVAGLVAVKTMPFVRSDLLAAKNKK